MAAALLLVLGACSDLGDPMAPSTPNLPAPGPLLVQSVLCRADRVAATVRGGAAALPSGARGYILVGGQGLYIQLTSSNVVVNAGVFVLGFRQTTARQLSIRQVLPGALAAAIGWQLLQSFGGFYVARVVAGAGAVNAVFALVLGLFAFLYLGATLVVICVEVNVVRVDHLHPRALLAPFTDDTDLTTGDQQVYAEAAQAQQAKSHQRVDVTFEDRRSGTG